MGEPEKIPTLAELVKAKMDKEAGGEAAGPSSSGEPQGRFWWVGLVTLIFIGVVAAGKILIQLLEKAIFLTKLASGLKSPRSRYVPVGGNFSVFNVLGVLKNQ